MLLKRIKKVRIQHNAIGTRFMNQSELFFIQLRGRGKGREKSIVIDFTWLASSLRSLAAYILSQWFLLITKWSYQQDVKPSPASNNGLNAHFIYMAINHLWFNAVKHKQTRTKRCKLKPMITTETLYCCNAMLGLLTNGWDTETNCTRCLDFGYTKLRSARRKLENALPQN